MSKMPQIFKVGEYRIYFWTNESNPLEPIHVHVIAGRPQANATKIWITQTGRTILCNNASRIPPYELRRLMKIIEANSDIIIERWLSCFNTISYYC